MFQGVRDPLLSEFSMLVGRCRGDTHLDCLLEYSLIHACDDTVDIGGKVCDDIVGKVKVGGGGEA